MFAAPKSHPDELISMISALVLLAGGMPSVELLQRLDARGVLTDAQKSLFREIYTPKS